MSAPDRPAKQSLALGTIRPPPIRNRLFLIAGLGVVLLALNNVAANPRFQWSVVGEYLFDAAVLRGFMTTLWLTAAIMAIGVVLGIVLALMGLSANPRCAASAPSMCGSSAARRCSCN